MGCCGQRTPRKKEARQSAPALTNPAMIYTTSRPTMPGTDGQTRSMTGPLVKVNGRPQGGWWAAVPVKGQTHRVNGRTAVETYNASMVLLKRNGVTIQPQDLWISLNIQWLSRTPEKYHAVNFKDLLAVAGTTEQPVKDSRRRDYKPSDWGRYAWMWLNLFLAREEFHYRDFLTQCLYVLDMLNPNTNAGIGCADCYKEWGMLVEDLKRQPNMDREAARQWLWQAHNSVSRRISKRELTFEQAAKAAFWT